MLSELNMLDSAVLFRKDKYVKHIFSNVICFCTVQKEKNSWKSRAKHIILRWLVPSSLFYAVYIAFHDGVSGAEAEMVGVRLWNRYAFRRETEDCNEDFRRFMNRCHPGYPISIKCMLICSSYTRKSYIKNRKMSPSAQDRTGGRLTPTGTTGSIPTKTRPIGGKVKSDNTASFLLSVLRS